MDEQDIRKLLISEFSKLWYETIFAINGEDAISKINTEKAHIAITDVKIPNVDELGLLKAVKEKSPETEVVRYCSLKTSIIKCIRVLEYRTEQWQKASCHQNLQLHKVKA